MVLITKINSLINFLIYSWELSFIIKSTLIHLTIFIWNLTWCYPTTSSTHKKDNKTTPSSYITCHWVHTKHLLVILIFWLSPRSLSIPKSTFLNSLMMTLRPNVKAKVISCIEWWFLCMVTLRLIKSRFRMFWSLNLTRKVNKTRIAKHLW